MIVKAGSTNVSVYYYIVQDASATSPGEPVTGLLFSDIETGGSASYARQGAARVDLTLITLASASAGHADGGFIEVDGTNMKGLYRCDYPDAAWVTGVDQTFCQIVVAAANNAVAAPILVDIDDNINQTGDGYAIVNDSVFGNSALNDSLSQIANVGAAIHVSPIPSPNGFTLTTGSEVNNEDATVPLDGTRHELSDAAGTLDAIYKFDIEGDAVPVLVTFTGVYNSNNDSFIIEANTGTDGTPVWVQIGTLEGSNVASNVVRPFTMFNNMVVQDITGQVQVRVRGTGLTSSSFDTDQVFVSKSSTSRSVGYANGSIWVNTNASNTNTESFVDGVADNPVSTWAAALTLSANLGLTDFHIINGSTIQLTANSDNFSLFGDNWTLDLNGQSVASAHFEGATVSGTGTGSTRPVFKTCEIGTCTLVPFMAESCGLNGTITFSTAGDYEIANSHSSIAGPTTPIIDTGATVANINLTMPDYDQGIEIRNLNTLGTDEFSISGTGQIIYAASSSGTVHERGDWKETNTGGVTIIRDDNATGIITIDTVVDAVKVKTDQMVYTVTNQLDVNMLTHTASIPANYITAAGIATSALDGKGDWNTTVPPTVIAIREEMDTNSLDLNTLISGQSTINGNVLLIPTTAMRGTDGANTVVPASVAQFNARTILSANYATDAKQDTAQADLNILLQGLILQDTTIATLASQTSFTLTAGSVDNDAYNGATIVVVDASTSTQKAFGSISDYVGSTKTVTLAQDPEIFTMATTDKVFILSSDAFAIIDRLLLGSTHNIANSFGRRVREVIESVVLSSDTAQAGTLNTITLAAGEPSVDGTYDPSTVTLVSGTGLGQSRLILQYEGSTRIAVVDRNWKITPDATTVYTITSNAGREHVNEGLLQAATSTTATLNTLASSSDDTYIGQMLFIRSGLGDDQARLVKDYNGTTKIAILDKAWDVTPDTTSGYVMLPISPVMIDVTAQATLDDIPNTAEFEARTPTAAQLAYIVANAATGLPVTFTTVGGSTTAAVLNLVDGGAGSATNDQYNGRLLVFTDGTLKGVVTDITDYVGSSTTATITQIPFAPTASHNARLI